MDRRMAILSPNLATLGRCSPTFRPGALVAISLNGPPFSWSGFKSHRSMVLGPPFIHSRMQERFGLGELASAVAAANFPSQPDIDTVVLTAPTRSNWRRSRFALIEDMEKLRWKGVVFCRR